MQIAKNKTRYNEKKKLQMNLRIYNYFKDTMNV